MRNRGNLMFPTQRTPDAKEEFATQGLSTNFNIYGQ